MPGWRDGSSSSSRGSFGTAVGLPPDPTPGRATRPRGRDQARWEFGRNLREKSELERVSTRANAGMLSVGETARNTDGPRAHMPPATAAAFIEAAAPHGKVISFHGLALQRWRKGKPCASLQPSYSGLSLRSRWLSASSPAAVTAPAHDGKRAPMRRLRLGWAPTSGHRQGVRP
jgi:hypothetical protein